MHGKVTAKEPVETAALGSSSGSSQATAMHDDEETVRGPIDVLVAGEEEGESADGEEQVGETPEESSDQGFGGGDGVEGVESLPPPPPKDFVPCVSRLFLELTVAGRPNVRAPKD